MAEDLEDVKRRVQTMFRSLQFGVVAVIAIYALKIIIALNKGERFAAVYGDIEHLPWHTAFIIENSGLFILFVRLLSVGTIISLFASRKSAWSMSLGVIVSIFFVFVDQFIEEAYFEPLIIIIEETSKV